MPIISQFYVIIVRMYFLSSEHNPPHIHASYGEYAAIISINECSILCGFLPTKAYNLVYEWITLHQKELLEMRGTKIFKKIPPIN